MISIKKLLESIEDIEFEELKSELSYLTQYNKHTEAMLTIAEKYGLEDCIEGFSKLIQKREKNQGLTIEDAKVRQDLYNKMFEQLNSIIGKDKASELHMYL